MRILVTGGQGFVGHHVCAALIAQGHGVVSIDNISSGVRLLNPEIKNHDCNLCDMVALDSDFDFVIHCAARADVRSNWTSRRQRNKLWINNIDATINLLESVHARGNSPPIVFFSTGAVYGDGMGYECLPPPPCNSPYAASKLAGEALVQAYAYAQGTPWWVFRPGVILGEGLHHGHAADFVAQARKGIVAPLTNGFLKKTACHVKTAVDACLAAISGGLAEGIYNIGGVEWSWLDTVEVMRETGDVIVKPAEDNRGWIGDPMAVLAEGKLRSFGVTIHDPREGCRDALRSLGWRT